MNNNLLVLAAGASSRMRRSNTVADLSEEDIEAANTTSKALIAVGSQGRPLMDFLLLNAKKAGYDNIYLIVAEDATNFKEHYGSKTRNNSYQGLQLSYAIQYIPSTREKPFGTADALTQALEQYPHLQKETFTVCNCDNLYSENALRALIELPHQNAFIAYDRAGLKFSMDRISQFALVVLDDLGHLIDIVEKPTEKVVESYMDKQGKLRVSMNIFKLDGASLFPFLKKCPVHPERNEKELPTAILNYCNTHPGNFKAILFNEHVPDLTSKEDIPKLKAYLRKNYQN